MKALKLVLIAAALCATPALAVTVDSVGDNWGFDYDGRLDVNGVATVMPGLSSHVDFAVTDIFYDASVNRTFVGMTIVVQNTTDAAIWQQASVTGIGFDTDPDVKRFGSASVGDYSYLAINSELPTEDGFKVEVCVAGRSSICSGPLGSGTEMGEVGEATVYLAFAGDLTGGAIEFSNFGIRYSFVRSDEQGIIYGQGLGVPRTPPVPEPASVAVFGVGALIVGAALRRKRAA